jgi:hypothetical protein
MNIICFFTDNGTPKTGLSPVVDVWKLDGTQAITSQAMTEIGGGFYKYDFSTYDETEDYCIRADGTNTLSDSDRYVFSTNETAGVSNILKIQKNKWEILRNQLIFYDDDGSILYKFDLQNKAGGGSDRDVYKRIPV